MSDNNLRQQAKPPRSSERQPRAIEYAAAWIGGAAFLVGVSAFAGLKEIQKEMPNKVLAYLVGK